jgi:hypothetical protein
MRRVYLLPALLAFAALALLMFLTQGAFWPLAIVWLSCAAVVVVIRNRRWRVIVTVALLPICVLTTFEGGLLMLPAVVSLLAIDARFSVPRAAGH